MKRSEIVEVISSFLQYWDGYSNKEVLAGALLDGLISHGMKPPHSEKAFQKNCTKYVEPHGYEWDDENDNEPYVPRLPKKGGVKKAREAFKKLRNKK